MWIWPKAYLEYILAKADSKHWQTPRETKSLIFAGWREKGRGISCTRYWMQCKQTERVWSATRSSRRLHKRPKMTQGEFVHFIKVAAVDTFLQESEVGQVLWGDGAREEDGEMAATNVHPDNHLLFGFASELSNSKKISTNASRWSGRHQCSSQ